MMCLYRRLIALFILGLTLTSVHADEYVTVEPAELKSNPQAYWARGVVFSDVVETVGQGEPLKLDGQLFSPITTRGLGLCYVDPALAEAAPMEPGREYAFSGSVYQKETGFFTTKRTFHVVISRATVSARESSGLSPEQLKALAQESDHPYAEAFRTLDVILSQALRDLQAYCSASNIEMRAVFAAGSPHTNRVTQVVRQAIYNQESRSRIPAVEYLVSLVTSLLAVEQGAFATPPAQSPAPEPPTEVPTEPVVEDKPAPTAVDMAAEPEVITEEAVPEPVMETATEPAMEPDVAPLPEPVLIEPAPQEAVTPEAAPEPALEPMPEPMPEAMPEAMPEPMPEPEVAQPEAMESPAPVDELLFEQPMDSAPAPAPVEPEILMPVIEEAPPVNEPTPVVEETAPAAVMPEVLPVEETEPPAPPRRSSTLPAATLKLPAVNAQPAAETAPEPAKKPRKSKKQKAAEPVVEQAPAQEIPAPEPPPARKPSLLDADPAAPVPLR